MKYATGYVPDGADHKRTPFGNFARRLGIASLPPSALVLASFLPSVLDQGQTGSCTGHASACAIFTEFAARGEPLGFVPSPAEIYRNGRAIDRADPSVVLTDDGAQPNQVYRAIEEFGVRAMGPMALGRYSDADPATINVEPQWGDLETEALTLLVGDYEIVTTGDARIVDVQTALVAQRPVTIAIAGGSDAFQGYTGGVLGLLSAPLDHYVTLYGFDTDPINGQLIFYGRNSWGTGWGESGNFRLGQECIAELGDLVVAAVTRKAAR